MSVSHWFPAEFFVRIYLAGNKKKIKKENVQMFWDQSMIDLMPLIVIMPKNNRS